MRNGLAELPRAAQCWVLLVYAAGLLVLAEAVSMSAGVSAPASGVVVALAVIGAMVEARSGRVHVIGEARKDLASVWVLTAALVAPAYVVVVVATTAYLALALAAPSRRQPVRVAFNISTYVIAGVLAHMTFASIADATPSAATPWTLVGMVAAAVVLTVVSTVVVAEVQHRLDGEKRRRLYADAAWGTEAALCCVALLVAVVVDVRLVLGLLALPPVLLLYRGLLHRQMLDAARSDPKTGLLNHSSWLVLGERAIGRSQVVSVLLVDLDHFKDINDHHGHLVGDQVLVTVAGLLTDAVRPGDLLGRFGGEEFAVLLPGADRATAAKVGERLREAVARETIRLARGSVHVTASIGAVTAAAGLSGESGASLQRLLEEADAALYGAKRGGRNRLVQAPDLVLAQFPAAPPVAPADDVPPVEEPAGSVLSGVSAVGSVLVRGADRSSSRRAAGCVEGPVAVPVDDSADDPVEGAVATWTWAHRRRLSSRRS